jgi:hypothetical protein
MSYGQNCMHVHTPSIGLIAFASVDIPVSLYFQHGASITVNNLVAQKDWVFDLF